LGVPVGVVKFAEFELDRGRYELRRGDRVLKLEKIPMELLVLLAESDGQLVTRDEIVERVWGKDVFLDTEHGINTAIRKIRQTLGDDPESPRFVQTVTGKGYRFIAVTSAIPAKENEKAATVSRASTAERPAVTPSSETPGDPGPMTPAAPATEDKPRVGRAVQISGLALIALSGIAAAVFGLNVRGVRDWFSPASPVIRIHSLAVLPLENLSNDPAQEYFADGMTDELITMLAKNPELRVVSRTSVMQYKKVHRPLLDVARELGVDGILEGSVERSGSRVHVNAQLIYAPQDRHLWAESYDRDLNDLGLLQSELARTIAAQVGLTTTPPARPERRRIKPEARDAYMLGRYYWFADRTAKGREYFRKAIQLQPDYAAAHAALADSYLAEVVTGAPKAELQEAMTKGEQAARQAIALDDSNAEAHLSMAAFHLLFAWDFREAEKESARSIELNPSYSESRYMRANILLVLQRIDEAVQEDRKSMELDPRIRPWALGQALLRARQYDAGIAEMRARVEVQPDDTSHAFLSDLYWQKGMFAESIHELALAYVPKSAAELEAAFQRGGPQGAMEWRLAHWKKLNFYVSPLAYAETYARLGRKEEALHYLERAYDDHVPVLVFIQNEPAFDSLHDDPRYQAIVKKMGLPAAS
jgi:TolB-like protein/DNA-binding winged helix-turn-helix (wHTH) protein